MLMNSRQRNFIFRIVKAALKEDIGEGDITTSLVIPEDKYGQAILVVKEECIVCGLDIAKLAFRLKDARIKFKSMVEEGEPARKGKILANISGSVKGILAAERVALNFLGHLCGIATKTRRFVDKTKLYRAKILDTRKTQPGLRLLEKYAVKVGGGYNHRFKLDEMVLIKDNHLKIKNRKSEVESLTDKIRKKIPKGMKIEIEVKNLEEFKQAQKARPDIIMLDNMKLKDIRRAVSLKKGSKPKIEVSGNVDLNNVEKIAKTGVDMISIGELTHSVKAVDISLEILC